ncbi:unnamed protein product [Colias eurytheme]|nr:unnamed protein product [Colias eurytheme]
MGSPTHSIQPITMNRCPIHIILPIFAILLPYTSTLNLPSGDPAPGRSPGPPFAETKLEGNQELPIDTFDDNLELPIEIYDETTTDMTTVEVIGDACDYARIPSDSAEVVTLGDSESEVNLTVSHPVFDVAELVRGVVYDGEISAAQEAQINDFIKVEVRKHLSY